MKQNSLMLLLGLLWACIQQGEAQTKLRLATIIPGTEIVQWVANGDFQAQGTVTATNTHPFPTGRARRHAAQTHRSPQGDDPIAISQKANLSA